MGIFFPGNWPVETLVQSIAVLCLVVLVYIVRLACSFMRPAMSLIAAREQAEKNVRNITEALERAAKRLQEDRKYESQQLDEVFELAQRHIRPDITRDEAAMLTTDAIGFHDWGYSERIAKMYIKHHQDAVESSEAAQAAHEKALSLYDVAIAQRKELQQYTDRTYRKHQFKGRDWRAFRKGVLKFVGPLLLWLYCVGVVSAYNQAWEQNARSAISQDEVVVGVSYNLFGADTATIDRNGCQVTFPVEVRSSTDYEFIGDGKIDLKVHEQDGKYVAPCLDWLNE